MQLLLFYLSAFHFGISSFYPKAAAMHLLHLVLILVGLNIFQKDALSVVEGLLTGVSFAYSLYLVGFNFHDHLALQLLLLFLLEVLNRRLICHLQVNM